MRPTTALAAFACGVVPVLCAAPAHATDCSGVLSPCIDDDALWPHAGPAQFVAIGSTDTVGAGRLGFGLVTTYLSRPIVLDVPSPGGGGSEEYAIDNQVNGTFLWAYGVTERLELDLAVPVTYFQDGTGLAPLTGGDGLHDTATRDMRFGFTYEILRHAAPPSPEDPHPSPQSTSDGFGLAARLETSAPTGDRTQLAGEGYATFVPSLAADLRARRFFAGLEVGARLRPTVDLVGAEIGSQIVTEIGAGYDILPRSLLTAAVEAWALPTLSQQKDVVVTDDTYTAQPNGRTIAPAEWQLSVRTAPLPGGDLALQVGGGGALPLTGDVPTQPRFRFTLGVRWAPSGPVGTPPLARPEPSAAGVAP
jgi:OmpA-OmpF porin, OOP family